MHTHFQASSGTFGSVLQLATGITTIRDLAADTDVGVAIRDQANAGKILTPRTILAGFIEGPGACATKRWRAGAAPRTMARRTSSTAKRCRPARPRSQ
jgi:hypothetical protein